MRPILLPCFSVNMKLLSDPVAIATGMLFGVGIRNSLSVPAEGDTEDEVAVGVILLTLEREGVALPLGISVRILGIIKYMFLTFTPCGCFALHQ